MWGFTARPGSGTSNLPVTKSTAPALGISVSADQVSAPSEVSDKLTPLHAESLEYPPELPVSLPIAFMRQARY